MNTAALRDRDRDALLVDRAPVGTDDIRWLRRGFLVSGPGPPRETRPPLPDGFVDFRTDGSGDPGCFNPYWFAEDPECQDGINNDPEREGLIDFDGGDPECREPWDTNEWCGLGAELALLLPPLMWMWRRRPHR